MAQKDTGKCLCGEVTYIAEGPPIVVAQCHCEECRRLSGTGHTVGAMFLSGAVNVKGKLSEFSYSSDRGSEVTKVFCANCGSPIYGKNTRIPDHLTLSLGTMDDANGPNQIHRVHDTPSARTRRRFLRDTARLEARTLTHTICRAVFGRQQSPRNRHPILPVTHPFLPPRSWPRRSCPLSSSRQTPVSPRLRRPALPRSGCAG